MPKTNSLNTRIQLKIDTEEHWNLASNFRPMKGEIIIYSADTSRPFSRLKVGNGTNTVTQLPFIDAGSVNGRVIEDVIQVYTSKQFFPVVGDVDSVYINLAENQLYAWDADNEQYVRIGGQDYIFEGGVNSFGVTPSIGAPYTVNITPYIPRNITGGGENNYLVKFDSANTITTLAPLTPITAQQEPKYLRQDGTWQVPSIAVSNKVTQKAQGSNNTYFPLLFKYSPNILEETDYVRFINTNKIGVNPVNSRIRANGFYIASTDSNTGIFPYANRQNTIGSPTIYWNAIYGAHYYGEGLYIKDWYGSNGERNVGISATENSDAIRGTINFLNECYAGDVQTHTTLEANVDAEAGMDITITLPASMGETANGLLLLADGSNVVANTIWPINISGYSASTIRDSEGNIIKDTFLKKSGGTLTGKLVLDGDPVYPLHAATKRYVDNLVSANSTMVFKGTIGDFTTNATVTFLPDQHSAGWTYAVLTQGYYAGQNCYPGDLIICVHSGDYDSDSDWSIISTHINEIGEISYDGNYLKLDGSNVMTGMIKINNTNGIKINANKTLKIWEVVGRNQGFINNAYGFYEQYNNLDDSLELYADNNTNINIKVRTVAQNGTVTWHTDNTFTRPIIGSITGNASTATTASNLIGFKATSNLNIGLHPSTVYQAIGYVNDFSADNWNYQQVDGALYQQMFDADNMAQIFQDYRSGHMSVRGKDNGLWHNWYRVLDESNYVSITGIGSAAYSDTTDFAPADRGVPTPATEADNLTFLRNDRTWYKLTSTELTTLLGGLQQSITTANLNDYILMNLVNGSYQYRTVGNVVTKAVIDNALSTSNDLNNKFYRGDGAWAVPAYPVSSVAGLTGAIEAADLRRALTLGSPLHFIGITTTNMIDGMQGIGSDRTGKVIINNSYVTPVAGDIVIDNDHNFEYLWTGSSWEQLGNDSTFKQLATQPFEYVLAENSNRWIRGIYQNTNGDITGVEEGTLVTTGLWQGTANFANSATSAIYDKANNDIAETYLRKTGDPDEGALVLVGLDARKVLWRDSKESLQQQSIVVSNQMIGTPDAQAVLFAFRRSIDKGISWNNLISIYADGSIGATKLLGRSTGADAADTWTYPRKVYVNLTTANTETTINGSSNANADAIGIGIDGVLPVANGGTGVTTVAALRNQLGLTKIMHFIGISATELTDGSTAEFFYLKDHYNPTQAELGDVVINGSNNEEFVWTGDRWEQLGRDNDFKQVNSQPFDHVEAENSNTWIRGIHQNINGDITSVDIGALVTSGLWTGTANLANTATVAINDKNNEDIVDTYVRKTGETEANAVIFTGSHAKRLIWKDTDNATQWVSISTSNQTNGVADSASPLFTFQHTKNSGITWNNLLTIYADGKIQSNGFLGNASSATIADGWTNARKIYVDLKTDSTDIAVNGSADAHAEAIGIGVNGVLGVENGGTGVTTRSDLIEALGLSRSMRYLGTTTTELSDGATTSPITIRNREGTVTPATGDVVIDSISNEEFIWTAGNYWERLGSDNNFKVMAVEEFNHSITTGSNKWISGIHQNTNGDITSIDEDVLITTGLWEGTANLANIATLANTATVAINNENNEKIIDTYLRKTGDSNAHALVLTGADARKFLWQNTSNSQQYEALKVLDQETGTSSNNSPLFIFQHSIDKGESWNNLITIYADGSIESNQFLGNASSATIADSWRNDRTVYVNLELDSNTTTINGSSNANANAQALGVQGILPVTNGGTGVNTLTALREALGLTKAMRFIGITLTSLQDGSDVQTISIKNNSLPVKAEVGDVVIDDSSNAEYIWTSNNLWERLGGDSDFKVVATSEYNSSVDDGTNQWVRGIHQNTNGDITGVDYGTLVTTGTWQGTANHATAADEASYAVAAGSADIATHDKNNNDIVDTYVRKSGDASKGAVVFTGTNARKIIWQNTTDANQQIALSTLDQASNTEDTEAPIFIFQHTKNSGTKWNDLLTIYADGSIRSNGFINNATNALTSDSWTNGRKVYVDLESNSTTTEINGSSDSNAAAISIGVSGVLPVDKGGTGVESLTELREAMGLTKAIRYIGTTTTTLQQGSSNNSIAIVGSNKEITPEVGDVVIDATSGEEFIWTVNHTWELLGRNSDFKVKAQQDYSYTITSDNTWICGISQNANGDITGVSESSLVTTGTWEGTANYAISAGKATNDENDSPIASTYVHKAGDQQEGGVVFIGDYARKIIWKESSNGLQQHALSVYKQGSGVADNVAPVFEFSHSINKGASFNDLVTIYANGSIKTSGEFIGNASSATVADSWTNDRALYVNLESDATDTKVNGSSNANATAIGIGVNGVLPVTNGGTGVEDLDDLREALGLTKAMRFIGICTTELSDGKELRQIRLQGDTEDTLAEVGDIVIDSLSNSEYIWTSSGKWERLGRDDEWALDSMVLHNSLLETNAGDILYAGVVENKIIPTVLSVPSGAEGYVLTISQVGNSLLPSWGTTTNITSLGTITAGTWNADTISTGYGGTGNNSYTYKNTLVYLYENQDGSETKFDSTLIKTDGSSLMNLTSLTIGKDTKQNIGNTNNTYNLYVDGTTYLEKVQVGNNSTYGNTYTPVYWNNGIPDTVYTVQKKSFEFPSAPSVSNKNSTIILEHGTAYNTNTIVLSIVVTEGQEYLTQPITWTAGSGKITLSTEKSTGIIKGYILTSIGVDLDI